MLACQDSRGPGVAAGSMLVPASLAQAGLLLSALLCVSGIAHSPIYWGASEISWVFSPVPHPTGLYLGGGGEYCESSVHIHT